MHEHVKTLDSFKVDGTITPIVTIHINKHEVVENYLLLASPVSDKCLIVHFLAIWHTF